MKNYFVAVTIHDPYERKFTKRIKASNPGMAASRAFRELRKEELKRKKVKWVKFEVTLI